MNFKHLRFPATLFFLLLLLLPRYPMAVPEAVEGKPFSFLTGSGGEHGIEVVEKRGGGAAGGAHGGGGGDSAAANGGGGDNGRGAGGQIPIYAAGAKNHNRDHRHHGSNSGTRTINRVGSSCLALIFFTSIPLFIV